MIHIDSQAVVHESAEIGENLALVHFVPLVPT